MTYKSLFGRYPDSAIWLFADWIRMKFKGEIAKAECDARPAVGKKRRIAYATA